MAILSEGLSAVGAGSLGTLFVKLTADSMELVKGMEEAGESIEKNSAAMLKAVGVMGAAVTAVLAGIGAEAIIEFGKFDAAMTRSTAIMGNMNAALRREMEETAKKIAHDSITPVEQLAEAYGQLSQSGFKAEAGMKALAIADKLGIAGVLDLKTATGLLTDAQAALGLASKNDEVAVANLSRVSDVLTKATTVGHASLQQFAEGLIAAGPAMRAANMSVEEGAAVLAVFAQQGIKGGEAGDQFGLVLRNLQKQAKENKMVFDELGVSVFDASTGKLKPMADVIASLDKAMGGMNAEGKRTILGLMGINERAMKSIQAISGTSAEIRGFEADMHKAGGTTDDVAHKQLESFNNQMKITWGRVKDALEVIGEGLAPVLKVFNAMLQASSDDTKSFEGHLHDLGETMGTGLLVAVGMIGDAFNGWRFILKMVDVASVAVIEGVLTVFDKGSTKIAEITAAMFNGINKGVNSAIDGLNLILSKSNQIAHIEGTFKVDPNASGLASYVKTFHDERVKGQQELDNMASGPSFSEKLIAGYNKAISGVKEGNAKIAADCKATVGAIEHVGEEAADTLEHVSVRLASLKLPEDVLKLNKSGEDEATKFARQQEMVFGKEAIGEDPGIAQARKLADQLKAGRDNLAILKDINEKEHNLNQVQQEKELAFLKAYNDKVHQLVLARNQMVFATSSKMFADLASIAETWGGKQSAMYKAMFAASKAFAIAEAIVQIQMGIAKAAGGAPWPANLAAIAQVVAATASIVSTISAVSLEFKGGKAMGGPVTAGAAFLVGERGPELFVPSEHGSIVPNNALGGGGLRVVVNNYTDAAPQVTEHREGSERVINVMIRRVKNEIGSEIRDGLGDVTRAMETSYNLRRGR